MHSLQLNTCVLYFNMIYMQIDMLLNMQWNSFWDFKNRIHQNLCNDFGEVENVFY